MLPLLVFAFWAVAMFGQIGPGQYPQSPASAGTCATVGGVVQGTCSSTTFTNPNAANGPVVLDGSGNASFPSNVVIGTSVPLPAVQSAIQQKNPYTLRSTQTKIAAMQIANSSQGAVSQLRVLVTGDSTAKFHTSNIVAQLQTLLGNAGAGLDIGPINQYGQGDTNIQPIPVGGWITTTGTVTIPDGGITPYDYTTWPTGTYYGLASGACAVLGVGPDYFSATQLNFAYIKEPGAGSLVFSSNNNGAGWVTESTISATNATRIGAVATVTKTVAPYQARACASGGAVKVISGWMVNTGINGVVFLTIARGGLDIASLISTPDAITTPIFTAIAPDLVTFESKDDGLQSASVYGGLVQSWLSQWRAIAPLADFMLIGSSPTGYCDATLACAQVAQNTALQNVALANSAFYYDDYFPSLTGATEAALGWLSGDLVHQTALGQTANSNLLWQATGLGQTLYWQAPAPAVLSFLPQGAFGVTTYQTSYWSFTTALPFYLKRIQATVGIPPAGCSVQPNIQLTNTFQTYNLPLANGSYNNDSGTISYGPFTANSTLILQVTTLGTGCVPAPGYVTVTAQISPTP